MPFFHRGQYFLGGAQTPQRGGSGGEVTQPAFGTFFTQQEDPLWPNQLGLTVPRVYERQETH